MGSQGFGKQAHIHANVIMKPSIFVCLLGKMVIKKKKALGLESSGNEGCGGGQEA